MSNCSTCLKSVKSVDKIICSRKTCGKIYHCLCVNIKADAKCSGWACCKQPRPGDNSRTSLRHHEEEPLDSGDDGIGNVTRRKPSQQKQELLPPTAESDLCSSVRTVMKEELSEMKEQMVNMDKFIKFICAQNEELTKGLAATNKEMKNLKDENASLHLEMKTYETRLKVLEEDNARQQQWFRLNNLEIVGVPETRTEVTCEVVLEVAKHLGVEVNPGEVEFAHRVQPRVLASAERGRAIVVRFRNRFTKDRLVAAARRSKNLTAKDLGLGDNSRIYINEHLTKLNKALLRDCKMKAKELCYKYVWTKNCRIYMRKNDTSPPQLVNSTADLVKKIV